MTFISKITTALKYADLMLPDGAVSQLDIHTPFDDHYAGRDNTITLSGSIFMKGVLLPDTFTLEIPMQMIRIMDQNQLAVFIANRIRRYIEQEW